MMVGKQRKALVVDDNDKWLKTLTRLASFLGYGVSEAQTYDEAILELERSESPPDLIVADLRLRDDDDSNVDGLRLLEETRRQGRLKASIVVTGYPSPESRQMADRLGAGYLVKGQFTREDFKHEYDKTTERTPSSSDRSL